MSLNQRFWISTIVGSIVVILFGGLVSHGFHLGLGLLVLTVVAINLFFWVFVRWDGCLGWTGGLRFSLLFAFMIHVPTHLGYLVSGQVPPQTAVARMAQGVGEVFLAGLIATYFIRSKLCKLPQK